LNSKKVVTTHFKQYACILLGALYFVLPRVNAQPTIPQSKPSMTPASPVLPPTATSDPLAIQALHKVIEASGGMKVWRDIHSAKIRLAITPMGAAQAHEFLMLDDWSSDSTRYRRGAIGMTKAPKDHNGQTTFIASSGEQQRAVPEYDQARVLAGSLPAAAAEIILRKPSYIAVQASGAKCTSDNLCIDIYRQAAPKLPFVREEEWIISQSSGLPTVIDLLLPNLSGGRPVVEEFQFDQMFSQNGLQIPSRIIMRHPSGATHVRTVVSFQPNVEFDKAAFDKELSQ
jgi:hypothetical protein